MGLGNCESGPGTALPAPTSKAVTWPWRRFGDEQHIGELSAPVPQTVGDRKHARGVLVVTVSQ